MIVEVFVEAWQLDCCGDAFGAGSAVTWGLHAAEPDLLTPGILRFFEDHHDVVDETVPFWDVEGRVVEIYAVSHRLIPVPGAKYVTSDLSDVNEERVAEAQQFCEAPQGFSHSGFRVRLDVDDDVSLPGWRRAAWIDESAQRERLAQESIAAYRASSAGRRLSEFGDHLSLSFSGRIDVERDERTTGVTIRPRNSLSCVVRWRCAETQLIVCVGDGVWSFEASLEGVGKLERLVMAAALGDVQERVLPDRLVTIVSEFGEVIEQAETPFGPFHDGAIIASAEDFARYRRGDIEYEPW